MTTAATPNWLRLAHSVTPEPQRAAGPQSQPITMAAEANERVVLPPSAGDPARHSQGWLGYKASLLFLYHKDTTFRTPVRVSQT